MKFESILDDDADEILEDLHAEIVEQFRNAHGTESKDLERWILDIEATSLQSLRPDQTSLSFTLRYELEGREDLKGTRMYGGVTVTIDAQVRLASGIVGSPDRTIYTQVELESAGSPIPPEVLFPSTIGSSPPSKSTPLLTLSGGLHQKIMGFLNATSGFPEAASGSFARMFYLSAVTITTLGYGDIVPITNSSRIAVSIEAILGLILVGLFINSLFQERNNRNGEQDCARQPATAVDSKSE